MDHLCIVSTALQKLCKHILPILPNGDRWSLLYRDYGSLSSCHHERPRDVARISLLLSCIGCPLPSIAIHYASQQSLRRCVVSSFFYCPSYSHFRVDSFLETFRCSENASYRIVRLIAKVSLLNQTFFSEESMIRYYPGRVEQTTQRQPPPEAPTPGRDRQREELERERERQRLQQQQQQQLERDRQRGTYQQQRPTEEYTHQQQYSRPTAYPQIAITYTEPSVSDPWGLTKADDRRSPPAEHRPSQSGGDSSSDSVDVGRTDINDPWGIMDRSRSPEIADNANDRGKGGRDRGREHDRGRDRYEVSSSTSQRYDQRQPSTPSSDRRHGDNNNQPYQPTSDNRSRPPPTTTARTYSPTSRTTTSTTTTTPRPTPTRRPKQPPPTTKYTDYDPETLRPESNTDFRETNVWPVATPDSDDRPPWVTTTPPPPPTTTTPYVTYAPPPAGIN